jgi:acetolactate synthase-1/2/3 large subunit
LKGYEAIVNILQKENVNHLTLFPGGGASGTVGQIANECAKKGIRAITARKERVAINIADGFSRTSGRVGVVLITAGVGAENAFSGLSQAHSDHVPLLFLVGGTPRSRIGSRPTQDFDVLYNYLKITKWVQRVNIANRIPECMRRAFTYLRTGLTGPICLEIPPDVAAEDIRDDLSYEPVRGWKMGGDPNDVRNAVRTLLAAESPLLYAGEGIFYARAWEELKEVAELAQFPVMTTLKAKGVFPENHPLSLGCGGRGGGKLAAHFLRKADLIFAIGASLTRGPGAPIPKDKAIIHSSIDPMDVNRNYPTRNVILGDSKIVLRQGIEEIKKSIGESRKLNEKLIREIKVVKEEWINECRPKLTSNETPINPYRLIWDLMHTVDRANTIINPDAGWPRDCLAPFWETITPRGFIGWGHHSTMGGSLGFAIGAKLAEPEKISINYMGDGAFGMVGMDFETAVREEIPILTIMTNNGGLGHYYDDVPSIAYLGGNFAKVAEALGGYGERIESPDEIIPAIERGLDSVKSGKSALLEFMTKREHPINTKYWADL